MHLKIMYCNREKLSMVKYKKLSLRLTLASIGVIISTEFNTPHELEKRYNLKVVMLH